MMVRKEGFPLNDTTPRSGKKIWIYLGALLGLGFSALFYWQALQQCLSLRPYISLDPASLSLAFQLAMAGQYQPALYLAAFGLSFFLVALGLLNWLRRLIRIPATLGKISQARLKNRPLVRFGQGMVVFTLFMVVLYGFYRSATGQYYEAALQNQVLSLFAQHGQLLLTGLYFFVFWLAGTTVLSRLVRAWKRSRKLIRTPESPEFSRGKKKKKKKADRDFGTETVPAKEKMVEYHLNLEPKKAEPARPDVPQSETISEPAPVKPTSFPAEAFKPQSLPQEPDVLPSGAPQPDLPEAEYSAEWTFEESTGPAPEPERELPEGLHIPPPPAKS